MSNLEHIHSLVAEAERGLKALTEKEQQKQLISPVMYTFVYEQRYSDAPDWGTNSQQIQAHSIGEAFQIFGRVVDEYKLTVRNVCYGFYDEMEPELDRISRYWREQREIRKQAESHSKEGG